jgi:hypothetical protein
MRPRIFDLPVLASVSSGIVLLNGVSLCINIVGFLAKVIIGGRIVLHSSSLEIGQGAGLSSRLDVVWSQRSQINCFSLDRFGGGLLSVCMCWVVQRAGSRGASRVLYPLLTWWRWMFHCH